jgi:hypothetical protein
VLPGLAVKPVVTKSEVHICFTFTFIVDEVTHVTGISILTGLLKCNHTSHTPKLTAHTEDSFIHNQTTFGTKATASFVALKTHQDEFIISTHDGSEILISQLEKDTDWFIVTLVVELKLHELESATNQISFTLISVTQLNSSAESLSVTTIDHVQVFQASSIAVTIKVFIVFCFNNILALNVHESHMVALTVHDPQDIFTDHVHQIIFQLIKYVSESIVKDSDSIFTIGDIESI